MHLETTATGAGNATMATETVTITISTIEAVEVITVITETAVESMVVGQRGLVIGRTVIWKWILMTVGSMRRLRLRSQALMTELLKRTPISMLAMTGHLIARMKEAEISLKT